MTAKLMESILRVENIYKAYGGKEVLHDISFELEKGGVLGIVGESGSGKSTLARVITGLTEAESGRIWLLGEASGTGKTVGPGKKVPFMGTGSAGSLAVPGEKGTNINPERCHGVPDICNPEDMGAAWQQLFIKRGRETRRRIQMVFQNPESSLNPRYKVGQILYSSMAFHIKSLRRAKYLGGGYTGSAEDAVQGGGASCTAASWNGLSDREFIYKRIQYLLERLKLPADTISRYPGSFSGGQKQRIALARALSVEPDILIADEPTSSLDVSVQFRMLELLKEIQRESGLSMIFISHDLGVINYICSRVIIMKDGRIVECGGKNEFFSVPKTSYGMELINSVPG